MKTYEETLDLMNDFADGVVQLNKMHDSDLSNIIVALKKQISKKVKVEKYFYGRIYYCPKCRNHLGYSHDNFDDVNFCSKCGKKLDWKE